MDNPGAIRARELMLPNPAISGPRGSNARQIWTAPSGKRKSRDLTPTISNGPVVV
jgi:hypothetical protein